MWSHPAFEQSVGNLIGRCVQFCVGIFSITGNQRLVVGTLGSKTLDAVIEEMIARFGCSNRTELLQLLGALVVDEADEFDG